MKIIKQVFSIFLGHGISRILGWCAGLIVVQLINSFVEEEGIVNLWGLWSDKMVVDHSAFTIISWVATAIVGWAVSQLWERLSEKLLKTINYDTRQHNINH